MLSAVHLVGLLVLVANFQTIYAGLIQQVLNILDPKDHSINPLKMVQDPSKDQRVNNTHDNNYGVNLLKIVEDPSADPRAILVRTTKQMNNYYRQDPSDGTLNPFKLVEYPSEASACVIQEVINYLSAQGGVKKESVPIYKKISRSNPAASHTEQTNELENKLQRVCSSIRKTLHSKGTSQYDDQIERVADKFNVMNYPFTISELLNVALYKCVVNFQIGNAYGLEYGRGFQYPVYIAGAYLHNAKVNSADEVYFLFANWGIEREYEDPEIYFLAENYWLHWDGETKKISVHISLEEKNVLPISSILFPKGKIPDEEVFSAASIGKDKRTTKREKSEKSHFFSYHRQPSDIDPLAI